MKLHYFFLTALMTLSAAANATTFTVTSTDIADGKALTTKQVLNGFGCEGSNLSPQLSWQGAPEGTQSFAVTVFDPDAPTDSGWWHWTLFNIPASTTSLQAGVGSHGGKLPKGAIQGRTDFGQTGFGGACPPPGDKPHRYQVTVWALKVPALPIDKNASGAMVSGMLKATMLEKAQITANYGR